MWIATGHYARRVRVGAEFYVRQAADSSKDQSYFLYRLPSAQLARIVFPLAEWTKAEVRGAAREVGLAVATHLDS